MLRDAVTAVQDFPTGGQKTATDAAWRGQAAAGAVSAADGPSAWRGAGHFGEYGLLAGAATATLIQMPPPTRGGRFFADQKEGHSYGRQIRDVHR